MVSPAWPDPADGPLYGMRVLDLSQQLPGPYATALLGELGAAVIKVEPVGGDVAHSVDPLMHQALHTGKAVVELDLKSDDGRRRMHELARESGAVIEGWRPGVAARLGGDPLTLSDINPALLVCSVTGYGASGPLAGQGAHDLNVQAVAGALADGTMIDRVGVPWVDLATGAIAALVVSNAWWAGRSGWIDLSLLDVATSWTRIKPGAVADREPVYGTVATGDGRHYAIAVLEDPVWRRLCSALGWSDLADDDRLRGPAGRRRNADEIRDRLNRDVAAMTTRQLEALIADHDLPITPFGPISDAAAAQLAARGFGADSRPQLPGPVPWSEFRLAYPEGVL